MGYRSQSGESQFRGSTQPQQDNVGQQIVGSVVDVIGTELINIGKANRLRKEVNSQLAQESMKNQELLMNEMGVTTTHHQGGTGKLAPNSGRMVR